MICDRGLILGAPTDGAAALLQAFQAEGVPKVCTTRGQPSGRTEAALAEPPRVQR